MGGKVSFPIIEIPKERIFIVTGANTGEDSRNLILMSSTIVIFEAENWWFCHRTPLNAILLFKGD